MHFDPLHSLTWTGKGLALDYLERNNEALAAYEEALRLDPQMSTAWHHMIFLLYDTGRTAEAEEAERQRDKVLGW